MVFLWNKERVLSDAILCTAYIVSHKYNLPIDAFRCEANVVDDRVVFNFALNNSDLLLASERDEMKNTIEYVWRIAKREVVERFSCLGDYRVCQ